MKREGSERPRGFTRREHAYICVHARARDSYSLCNLTRIGIALLLQKENRCGVKSIHVRSPAILKRRRGTVDRDFRSRKFQGDRVPRDYRAELDDIVVLRLVPVQQPSVL